MNVVFHRTFEKQLRKLPRKIQNQFLVRLGFFVENARHPLLHIHTLSGVHYPLQSMNVNADYRALFIIESDRVVFYEIGTHSALYA